MPMLMYQGLQFGLKVATVSTILWYLATRVFADNLPPFVVHNIWRIAIPVVWAALFIDGIFIYPFFRSPLRKVRTVKERGLVEISIIAETPRGKTPLRWYKENPGVDLIHLRGIANKSSLFPVSPEALRDIMSTNTYDFEKPMGVRAFLARVIGYGLILSEGSPHKRQRKALTPAFNIKKIRELYGLMWEKTGILLEEIEKDIKAHPASTKYGEKEKGKGLVEISEWASKLTLDIIGPTAMGRDFQSLTSEANPVAEAFLEILEPSKNKLAYFACCFFMPQWLLRALPWNVNYMLSRTTSYLRNLSLGIVKEKRKELRSIEKPEQLSRYDILSQIISAGDFTDDEIVDQMLTFLAAGHETTASALTWCSYLLSHNQDIQDKLRQEIRETITSSDSPITYDVLEGMPFLNGVCEETLRLFPTVPTTIREAVRDTHIAGQAIPKDTLIIISPYAVNRNPNFWGEDAEEMRPERWIETAPDGTQKPNKNGGASSNYAEITFLHGQRACIGRDFAKAELRCAIAGVFGKFRVEMEDPKEDITIAGVVTTKPRQGMKLKMEAVDGW